MKSDILYHICQGLNSHKSLFFQFFAILSACALQPGLVYSNQKNARVSLPDPWQERREANLIFRKAVFHECMC